MSRSRDACGNYDHPVGRHKGEESSSFFFLSFPYLAFSNQQQLIHSLKKQDQLLIMVPFLLVQRTEPHQGTTYLREHKQRGVTNATNIFLVKINKA
jgi:hypothetical protein